MSLQHRGSLGESTSFLKEVGEKKENLRRIASEVGNMAAELQNVRSRAAQQEAALQQEASKRQVAEANASEIARQLEDMQKSLEDARSEARNSASVAGQSLKELMEVTERLTEAEEITEVITASSNALRAHYETLLKEIEQKSLELQQQKNYSESLEEQLVGLKDDLKRKENAQKQLRYEIQDLEAQIELTMGRSYTSKECEFRKLLNEVSERNIEHLEKHLMAKDDEIARLRHELASAQAETKLRSTELTDQVDKHQRTVQELQKKVIKLEFCLQEAQMQARKLKKMAEKKEQENQNLRAQIWLHEATPTDPSATFGEISRSLG